MSVSFSAHNIRLDDGTFTKPEVGYSMESYPWFVSARRVLNSLFPGDKSRYRLADLGCLEGGYAVEFARMGFQVLGVDVRESNIEACRYVKEKTSLPNLTFARDDAWNLASHGRFDVVFCCGLFYHFDRPKQFLEMLSSVTNRLLILQTHFAVATISPGSGLPALLRLIASRVFTGSSTGKYALSRVTENESLRGRWYCEFLTGRAHRNREDKRWASWDNRRSFWVQREYLLQAIFEAGFDCVLEQFDSLGPDIAEAMTRGYYKSDGRGTFIGIKTEAFAVPGGPA